MLCKLKIGTRREFEEFLKCLRFALPCLALSLRERKFSICKAQSNRREQSSLEKGCQRLCLCALQIENLHSAPQPKGCQRHEILSKRESALPIENGHSAPQPQSCLRLCCASALCPFSMGKAHWHEILSKRKSAAN